MISEAEAEYKAKWKGFIAKVLEEEFKGVYPVLEEADYAAARRTIDSLIEMSSEEESFEESYGEEESFEYKTPARPRRQVTQSDLAQSFSLSCSISGNSASSRENIRPMDLNDSLDSMGLSPIRSDIDEPEPHLPFDPDETRLSLELEDETAMSEEIKANLNDETALSPEINSLERFRTFSRAIDSFPEAQDDDSIEMDETILSPTINSHPEEPVRVPLQLEYRQDSESDSQWDRILGRLKCELEPADTNLFRWMESRERGENRQQPEEFQMIRGGCISYTDAPNTRRACIALIVATLKTTSSPCSDQDNLPTLIVAPRNAMFEWEDELRAASYLRVCCYHGQQRRKLLEIRDFKEYDVILSTYDIVRAEECKIAVDSLGKASRYSKTRSRTSWMSTRNDIAESKELLSRLHMLKWRRIFLDEAILIAKTKLERFRKVNRLVGMSKWCLLKKPIQTSDSMPIDGLVQFVGIPDDWAYCEALPFIRYSKPRLLAE